MNNCLNDGVIIADQDGFILFNQVAEQMVGIGKKDAKPSEWAQVYGVYKDDGVTQYESSELPLYRAINGESVDSRLVVRNEGAPEGRTLSVRARPIMNEHGQPAAGLVLLKALNGSKQAVN